LGDPEVDGSTTLKFDLSETEYMFKNDSGWNPVTGPCEHGDAQSGSAKGEKLLLAAK
jgi:hypothetical protein